MNQTQIEKLVQLTTAEIEAYRKVKGVLAEAEDSYICKEANVVNWFGREMQVGEIISASDYKEVQGFHKHCWRKLTLEELITYYKVNILDHSVKLK